MMTDNFSYLMLAGYILAIFIAIFSMAFSTLGAAEFIAKPLTADEIVEDVEKDRVEWPHIIALLIGVLIGLLSFFGVLYIIRL